MRLERIAYLLAAGAIGVACSSTDSTTPDSGPGGGDGGDASNDVQPGDATSRDTGSSPDALDDTAPQVCDDGDASVSANDCNNLGDAGCAGSADGTNACQIYLTNLKPPIAASALGCLQGLADCTTLGTCILNAVQSACLDTTADTACNVILDTCNGDAGAGDAGTPDAGPIDATASDAKTEAGDAGASDAAVDTGAPPMEAGPPLTIDDCRTYLSGLTKAGRDSMVACMTQSGCTALWTDCIGSF